MSFFGGKFAMLVATFGNGLQCQGDDLMPFFPLFLRAFSVNIIMHQSNLSVGQKILYGKAEEKN
jgi:hypothetical protein